MTATSQKPGFPDILLPQVWQVLRRIWPKHGRKQLERAANVSKSTASDWWYGVSCPRADDLIEIAARDDRALDEFIKVLGEIKYAKQRLKEMAREDAVSSRRDVGTAHRVAQPARGPARPAAHQAYPVRRAAA